MNAIKFGMQMVNKRYVSAGIGILLIVATVLATTASSFEDDSFMCTATTYNIINVTIMTSDPLDTDPLYGWENISCTITGNANEVAEKILLVLTYPNNSTEDILMAKDSGTYYYNMSLTEAGNYRYCIYANGVHDNEVVFAYGVFFLPTNWDVDMNGRCSSSDIVVILNRYSESGPSGWIREDVNNNGHVGFFDIANVVIHYGEYW